MSNSLFVDASVSPVRSDDGATILYKTTSGDDWFYAARAARVAVAPDGLFVLSLVRRRKREKVDHAGTEKVVTQGGVLAAQLELVALAPSAADETAWTDLLKRSGMTPTSGSRFSFYPLPLWQGRMTVGVSGAMLDDPDANNPLTIGAPFSAPIALRLNSHGADSFSEAFGAGSGPPVAVRFDYDFDLVFPKCAYRVEARPRSAYAVFRDHSTALAGFYGTVGGRPELDLLCEELRSSEAVKLIWQAKPEGFTGARVVEMEKSIIERWIKRSLDQMLESVEPDFEASGSGRGLGCVAVKLKPEAAIAGLDLSERHDAQQLLVKSTFSRSVNFGQLSGLDRDKYATDIEGDAAIPLIINFGRDPRVQQYVCQYGYRKSDGTVGGRSHEATGAEGLNVIDTISWNSGGPRPDHIEIKFLIDWVNLQWPTQSGKVVLETDEPCLAFSLSSAASIAEISLVSDLISLEVGSFAAINWNARLPSVGVGSRTHFNGSFLIEGIGEEGRLVREVVSFPYPEGYEAMTSFAWSVDLVMSDGGLFSGQESFSLKEKLEALIFRANLRPA